VPAVGPCREDHTLLAATDARDAVAVAFEKAGVAKDPLNERVTLTATRLQARTVVVEVGRAPAPTTQLVWSQATLLDA